MISNHKCRRWFCGLTVGSLILAAFTSAAVKPPPPNIILILADDLGYGDIGVFNQNTRAAAGHPAILTPRLDRMATEGRRFTQFYATPSCAPSRAALMTGLHNGHTDIRSNGENLNLDRTVRILPAWLQAGGYATGCFGKWGLGERDDTLPTPTAAGQIAVGEAIPNRKGFDEFFGYLSHSAAHFSFAPELLAVRGRRLWDTFGTNLVAIEPPAAHTQDLFAARALDFIQRHRREPFFLYLPFTLPHANATMNRLDAPTIEPAYRDQPWPDCEKKFASLITRLDQHIGQILDKLIELGLAENTLVLVASDNGAHYAGGHDHLFFNSSGPFRDRKFSLYEGGVHVPLLAWWPQHIPAGTTQGQVAAIWDLLPTFCELARVTPPPEIDGHSIVSALLGQPVRPDHPTHLYWEIPPARSSPGSQASRLGEWKAVRRGTNALELYNLSADPGEATNVAGIYPAQAEKMNLLQKKSTRPPAH